MIETDGAQPDLKGVRCEELLCQQYWWQGRLEDEADIVLLKVAGVWYQVYFDAGVVHWREQSGPPKSSQGENTGVFFYPLVDLGVKFGVKGQVIVDCQVSETADGGRVSLVFEQGAAITFVNRGDSTRVVYQR